MATQTVKFKGEFDVSQIMSAIKQMRAELNKQGNSPLFGNLDKEISKLEGLGSTIQAQIGKGFASNKEFKSFEANINKLELEFQKLGQSFDAVNANNLKNALNELEKSLSSMKTKASELSNTFKNSFLSNAKDNGVKTKVKDLTSELVNMAAAGKSFEEAQRKIISNYDELIKKQRQSAEEQRKNLELNSTPIEIGKTGFQKKQFKFQVGENEFTKINDAQLNEINKTFREIITSAEDAESAVKDFFSTLSEKHNILPTQSTKDITSGTVASKIRSFYQSYIGDKTQQDAQLEQYNQILQNAQNAEAALVKEKEAVIASLDRSKDSYNAATIAAQKYTDAESKLESQKASHKATSDRLSSAINGLRSNLSKSVATLKQTANETGQAVKTQESFNNSLDQMKTRIAYVFSLGNAYFQLRKILQQTLNDVENIDKAFASIAMVTDKTVSGLWESYGEYAQMAQKLGQSTESAIKASALFYQQGLKDVEVMELTEDTMKLATLAGLDFEKATSQMTAALRGFHMEMTEGAHVTDVYSELAAHAAADVNGIAYAMSKTASIANNAGMSFENTAAFLTQMIETTQEAPENIGTAMKTIIARFTELKENVAGTADSEFEDLDYNKVDKALKSVGVSIKDASGQFRNLDEVFLELSQKWDSLDRNSQRYIATIAAGSRQQSRFIAMMEDYERTLELVNITQDAEGRSNEQFAKNAESLTFKIQELKTAWEQFRMSIADSKFFKNIVDILKDFINTLNGMDKKQITAIGALGLTLGKSVIKNFADAISNSSKEISAAWQKAMQNSPLFGLGKQSEQLNVATAEIAKYDELNAKLEEYRGKLNQVTIAKAAISDETTEEFIQLQNASQEYSKQIALTEKLLQTQAEETNAALKQLGIEEQIEAVERSQINNKIKSLAIRGKEAIASGMSTALTAGLTSGAMMAVSGAELKTVLSTTLISALASVLPQVMAKLAPYVIGFITGPGGLAVIAAAGFAGLMHVIISENQKAEEAERKRLLNVKALNEEIDNTIKQSIADLKHAETKENKVQSNIDILNTLSAKKFLNAKEEKELQSAVDELNSVADGLVEFDEVTQHYQIVENKLDEIHEEIKHDKILGFGAINSAREQKASNISNRRYAIEDASANFFNDLFWTTTEQGMKAHPESSASGMRGAVSTYHIASKTRDFLTLANQGYGIDIDKYFGTNNLAQLLSSPDTELRDISAELDAAGVEVGDKADNIQSILKDILDEIDSIERNEFKDNDAKYIENILTAQGWGNASAVGKYFNLEAYQGMTTGDSIVAQAIANAGSERKFLKALSQNDLSVFGTNADLIRALFENQYEISDLSSLFKSGTNFKKIENLGKFGKALNVTESDWESAFGSKNNAKQATSIFAEAIGSAIIGENEYFSQASEKILADNKDKAIEFTSKLEDVNDKSWNEYQKEIESYVSKQTDETQQAFNAYLAKEEENQLKLWEDEIDKISQSGIDRSIAEELDYASLKYFSEQIKGLNLSTHSLTEYVNYINDTFGELDSDILNVLANINLENVNSLSSEETQKYVDLLTEVTDDVQKSQQLLSDYIAKTSLLLMKAGQGKDQAGLFMDIQEQSIKGYAKAYEDLLKAQLEYHKDGTISEKTYFNVLEKYGEEYVAVTSKGYEFLGNKAEEYLVTRAMEPLQNLRNEIDKQQIFIDEAIAGRKAGIKYAYDDSVLINQFKENPDALSYLDPQYFHAIELAATAGASSLSEFIKEAKEYKQELSTNEEKLYLQSLISLKNAYEDTEKEAEKLKDKLEELNETLQKNKETLDEARQKQYEAYHGTELFQSSLDGLANYNSKLSETNNLIEDLKENLTELDDYDENAGVLNLLNSAYNSKSANLSAQNVVINDALNNLGRTLLENYGDYVHFDGENALVDFAYLDMDTNDERKKAFEKEYQTYQDYVSKKRANNQEIKKLNKEREEFEKQYLNKYVSIQNEIIGILKEQAEKEVDITKDKYNALKEADEEYLSALEDAISKQRELRDKQNAEEELAQKEKRLSLMMRDTSGANAKDVQKLEKEIEDDRQKLLDDSIDSIINSMKEVYDKQAEARDAEIEYMESVTENAQYFNEWAKNIMESWQSIDDMQGWLFENNPDVKDMTTEQAEQYINDIQDKWNDLITYQSLQVTDFKANSEVINSEMTALYESTSENISSIGTITEAVTNKAVEDAQKAADKAVEEAEKAYAETTKKIAEAQEEFQKSENAAALSHDVIVKEMVKATKSGFDDVTAYAITAVADLMGVDLTNAAAAEAFAKQYDWKTNGTYSNAFKNAVGFAGGDTSRLQTKEYSVTSKPAAFSAVKPENSVYPQTFEQAALMNNADVDKAWVKNYLSGPLPLLNGTQSSVSSSIGDTNVEININVEGNMDSDTADYTINQLQQVISSQLNQPGRNLPISKH